MLVHFGMDKRVSLKIKIMIVLLELIGIISFVLVMQTLVHKEHNGMETIVSQLIKNVKLAHIGVVLFVSIFLPNVHLNWFGKMLKIDVYLLQIFVLQVHITTVFHVCHTALVKMVKFGAVL